jgi:hypothetical protein
MLQYFVVFFNISPPTKKSAVLKLRLSKQKCILTIKEENIYDVLTILLIYTRSRFKCYKKNVVFSGIKKISTHPTLSLKIKILVLQLLFISELHQEASHDIISYISPVGSPNASFFKSCRDKRFLLNP